MDKYVLVLIAVFALTAVFEYRENGILAMENASLRVEHESLVAEVRERRREVERLQALSSSDNVAPPEAQPPQSPAQQASLGAVESPPSTPAPPPQCPRDSLSLWRGFDLYPPIATLSGWQIRNYGHPRRGPHTLVAITVSGRARASVRAVLDKFAASPDYAFILFVYDNSEWAQETASVSDRVTVVHAQAQFKFWYYKRFLHPSLVAAYEYLYVLDEDICLNDCGDGAVGGTFDIERYARYIRTHNIPIACPAHGSVHRVMVLNERTKNEAARWANIAEIGPFFSISTAAWRLLAPMLVEEIVVGIGIDLTWCNFLAQALERSPQRTCAIVYQDSIVHLDSQSARQGNRLNYAGLLNSGGWESGLLARLFPRLSFPVQAIRVYDLVS